MLKLIHNQIIYYYNNCQQCGVCKSLCPQSAISFNLLNNGLKEVVINHEQCILCKKCINNCPANQEDDFNEYFRTYPEKSYFLGYNSNNNIRHNSSSGGVCKTLIIENLKSGYVDGVYSLKKITNYPYAEGEFYTRQNIPQYDDIPNSIYHSVMAATNIHKIQKCNRLMIIGTACQLKAMNKTAQQKCKELIKVCIFCKQQKTLDSTRFLAKIIGEKVDLNHPCKIQYRGNGWPGTVYIKNSKLAWNRAAQLPFGRRLWTVPGCDICGDAFGSEAKADISLMDPWNIRKENELGETLIIIHSALGLDLLTHTPNLNFEEKNFEEIEPALSLKDVWRKQQTIPFFRGKVHDSIIQKAGRAEIKQRKILSTIAEVMPRMPILFYRILCKFPDLRNKILK